MESMKGGQLDSSSCLEVSSKKICKKERVKNKGIRQKLRVSSQSSKILLRNQSP